jgi:hypothetical protein
VPYRAEESNGRNFQPDLLVYGACKWFGTIPFAPYVFRRIHANRGGSLLRFYTAAIECVISYISYWNAWPSLPLRSHPSVLTLDSVACRPYASRRSPTSNHGTVQCKPSSPIELRFGYQGCCHYHACVWGVRRHAFIVSAIERVDLPLPRVSTVT